MKIRFDPRGLLYFVMLLGGIVGGATLVTLSRNGEISSGVLLSAVIGLTVLHLLYRLVRIPLLVRFGGSAGVIRELRERLATTLHPVKRAQLHNFLFYIYYRRWKVRAAREELRRIRSALLPPVLQAVVQINLAGTSLMLEDYRAAKKHLDAVNSEGVSDRINAVWMMNRAAYLIHSDLDPVQGAEFAHRALKQSKDPRVAASLAGLLYKAGEYDAVLAWIRYGLKNIRSRHRYSRALLYYYLALIAPEVEESGTQQSAAAAGLKVCPGTLPLYRRLKGLAESG